MRIAVAGGTGTVGRHVVALAEEAGHEVIVLSPSHGVDAQTVVTLSIVGIHKMSFGYYQAKLQHERAAQSGSVPSTIMRATHVVDALLGSEPLEVRGDRGKELCRRLLLDAPWIRDIDHGVHPFECTGEAVAGRPAWRSPARPRRSTRRPDLRGMAGQRRRRRPRNLSRR
jgi:hypothetical protein